MNWSTLILWLALVPFGSFLVAGLSSLRRADQTLRRRLRDLSASPDRAPPAGLDDDVVTRLCSLAATGSTRSARRRNRWRRRLRAVLGSVGVVGWSGAVAVAASVGLISTGSLPAPVQRVVADVLEVVNVDVPRPETGIPLPTD